MYYVIGMSVLVYWYIWSFNYCKKSLRSIHIIHPIFWLRNFILCCFQLHKLPLICKSQLPVAIGYCPVQWTNTARYRNGISHLGKPNETAHDVTWVNRDRKRTGNVWLWHKAYLTNLKLIKQYRKLHSAQFSSSYQISYLKPFNK